MLSLIFLKKTLIRPSSPYLLAKKKKTRNPPGQNHQSNCATKITNTTSRNPIRTIDQLNPTENNQDQNKAIIATTLNHFCINNIFNSLSLFFLSKNSTTQQHHPSQQNKKKKHQHTTHTKNQPNAAKHTNANSNTKTTTDRGHPSAVVGKRKFDGGHQNPADVKRRYPSGLIGNGGSWGSLPLPQQPLGTNGEQWYMDTFSAWS